MHALTFTDQIYSRVKTHSKENFCHLLFSPKMGIDDFSRDA